MSRHLLLWNRSRGYAVFEVYFLIKYYFIITYSSVRAWQYETESRDCLDLTLNVVCCTCHFIKFIFLTVTPPVKRSTSASTPVKPSTRPDAQPSTSTHLKHSTQPDVSTPLKQSTQPDASTPLKQSTPLDVSTPLKQSAQPDLSTPLKQSTQSDASRPLKQSTRPDVSTPLKQSTQPDFSTPPKQSTQPYAQPCSFTPVKQSTQPDALTVHDIFVHSDILSPSLQNVDVSICEQEHLATLLENRDFDTPVDKEMIAKGK